VFLGGLAGPAADLGLGQQVQSAQLKLLAACRRTGAARPAASARACTWTRSTGTARPTPCRSWPRSRRRCGTSGSWRSPTKLDARGAPGVHPLGLVLKAGVWYLVAAREQKVRTYRVVQHRARREVLEAAQRAPKGFDLAAHWAESVQRFERELLRGPRPSAATARGLAHLRQMGGGGRGAARCAGAGRTARAAASPAAARRPAPAPAPRRRAGTAPPRARARSPARPSAGR
jgi:hypothetical protein